MPDCGADLVVEPCIRRGRCCEPFLVEELCDCRAADARREGCPVDDAADLSLLCCRDDDVPVRWLRLD
ncbi:MAG: hypothetical protein GX562_05385 [Coriobacteriaceae bacterium]|nr:hypothetical protein [Coriobacteriaceae bacterium]